MSDFVIVNIDKTNMFPVKTVVRLNNFKLTNMRWTIVENGNYSVLNMCLIYSIVSNDDSRIRMDNVTHNELIEVIQGL